MSQESGRNSKVGIAADPRSRIIDALLELAAEQAIEGISISDICAKAEVTLADFRDAFPSKGAVLTGFSRRVDRLVLQKSGDLEYETSRDRLFDVLMRRLEVMSPYREGLRAITQWLRHEPLAALALNRVAMNSMRFMLEAAGIDSEGAAGALKLQGLVVAWSRVVDVWLDDDEPEVSRTMAALDRELTRGERLVAGVERLDRFSSPLRALARAALDSGGRAAASFRHRGSPRSPESDRREQRP